MIIKCKMCGRDIQFNPGNTYVTCEFCGSTSTIPKADDEGKLNRYNRANHFRRQCEFDKAVAAYEKILEQDDTDAEAHWGAVISRFGIEYVEDPATGKRIPTCHRVQLTSILADEDYKAAVHYAPDAESRRLYEEEAARIAEIQRGILAISHNERPYDVFICCKETDDIGQRTHDSQWAQDVYYGLTEQGYKVFFSRITLEDKLGQEYEPYIFAALQSAKVMVVIGSKPEHFNAVWVKNEWSRYLALMAHDCKRLLIPCYRGMDPYDLPDELSSLQSQDMSKIGFMQDLIRGIRKVLEVDKKTEQPKVIQQVVQIAVADAAAPGVTSLMQRAYLFLEDGDFNSAAEYLDRVLDIDPKFAPAYAAKICVTFGIRKEADLAESTFQYEDNPDWQKAIRFADPQQKAVYEGYAAKVKERVARQIRDYAYDCAVEMAVLPGADRGKLDADLAAYKASCTSSTGKRADGSRRADSRMKEEAFKQTVKANEPGDVSESSLKTAAAMFTAIGDSEATERARQCKALAEQARQKAEAAAAKKKRNTILGILAAVVVVAVVLIVTLVIIPENNYRNAVALQQAGRYEEAITAFEALNGYGDSTTQITETKYLKAKSLAAKGNYAGAAATFIGIKGYKDVDSLLVNDNNLSAAAAARDAKYSVGNYVTFGHYPQTSGGNDNTPIEWLVLARDGNKALLLSRYGLDAKPYNENNVDIAWEKCTLRTWLNGTFLNKAFTAAEQKGILLTKVDNGWRQVYGKWNTSGGNDTEDRVFLLSYAEVNKYLGVTNHDSKDMKSVVALTAYAINQGADTYSGYKTADGMVAGSWWLRSPGPIQSQAAVVGFGGSLYDYWVFDDSGCVRPALWINLESDIF